MAAKQRLDDRNIGAPQQRGGELPFKAEVPLNRVCVLPKRIAEVSRLDEAITQRLNRGRKRVCGEIEGVVWEPEGKARFVLPAQK